MYNIAWFHVKHRYLAQFIAECARHGYTPPQCPARLNEFTSSKFFLIKKNDPFPFPLELQRASRNAVIFRISCKVSILPVVSVILP